MERSEVKLEEVLPLNPWKGYGPKPCQKFKVIITATGEELGQVYQMRRSTRHSYTNSRIGYDTFRTVWTNSAESYEDYPSRKRALDSLLEDGERILEDRRKREAQEAYRKIGFYVHGVRADNLFDVEFNLKSTDHDKSEVQWFDGEKFLDVSVEGL